MTLLALGSIPQLSLVENELHLDLAAARAEKLLRDDADPRVLAQNFSHGFRDLLSLVWMI
jgi:hypothetical protein